MQCPRCLNTDPSYFYHGSKGWYCRRCVSFGRVMLEEELEPVSLEEIHDDGQEYTLKYPLTPAQIKVSHECAERIEDTDILLKCVCGSGKTEMVLETIAFMLGKHKKVCFAIARRQVVLELAERLSGIFSHARVVPVCHGYTTVTDGDLIVCTTHQLYRYYQSFSLLILDEPDAFPFKGDPVLHGIARTSCHGHTIYLTATPDKELEKRVKKGDLYCLELNQRPHGHPLPEPDVHTGPVFLRLIWMFRWIQANEGHPRIIFVPTIKMGEWVFRFLRLWMPVYFCTSKTPDRDTVIENYRKEKAGIMIATTVLERGVTIPDVNICIYQADHQIFDKAGLIQMAGRAGRTFDYPDGNVLFIQSEYSQTAMDCINDIRRANQSCGV